MAGPVRRLAAIVPLLAWLPAAAVTAAGPGRRPPAAAPDYANTYAKDFLMDAPWRVVDADTPIPLVIVLKDCDVDNLNRLRWIECRDLTAGGVAVWHHDFGGETIGDDAPEHDYWTWLTTVSEGHPVLADGTPLTPANLGHAAGTDIELEVEIRFRDNWLWDESQARRLRVRVGGGRFPWPAGWYGGDAHLHSMYTNNIAEWGLPVPALAAAARAIGLQWLVVTDHSCDLDETGDGTWSYATGQWEITRQTPAGIATEVRDVPARGSSWEALGADVAAADGPALRLLRGVEINLASVDPASAGKTLHALFYGAAYVASPWSGAIGERPVFPTLPDGLDLLGGEGFAYAAHPQDDLGGEWGGIDLTVNGAAWGDGDYAAALLRDGFRGLEAFNTRAVLRSGDESDPWADFDAGEAAAPAYPAGLLAGLAIWDDLLRSGLGDPSRPVFLAGGSDAHGDLDYATYLALDAYATDNALGKVQTVVRVPGPRDPDDLPPGGLLLDALRAGRSVATDGPFLEIGIDRDGDGSWYGAADLAVGAQGRLHPDLCPPLRVRWASLPELGEVASVRVLLGDAAGTATIWEIDPRPGGQGLVGEATVALAGRGLAGPAYLRAELTTADGGAGRRACTNPIWASFEPLAAAPAGGPPAPALRLTAAPNPFNARLEIRLEPAAPARVDLTVRDLAGRAVRRLLSGADLPAGPRTVAWDGRGDDGRRLPSGAYLVRAVASGGAATLRVCLVR